MPVRQVWKWLAEHWKLWGIPAIGTAVAGIIKWLYEIKKAKAEAALAEAQRKQIQADVELRSEAQIVRIYTDAVKKAKGRTGLIFSDEELRNALEQGRGTGARLHAVMRYLEKEGIARKSEIPGYWHVD